VVIDDNIFVAPLLRRSNDTLHFIEEACFSPFLLDWRAEALVVERICKHVALGGLIRLPPLLAVDRVDLGGVLTGFLERVPEVEASKDRVLDLLLDLESIVGGPRLFLPDAFPDGFL